MKELPLVSVILSAYNAEKYIKEAIESILTQEYGFFELIIINDGSNDLTLEIIKSFEDERIRIINQENKGLIYSLNLGLSMAKGKYIARMDADDIAFPKRLKLQVDFLEKNPEYIICGTNQVLYFENDVNKVFYRSNLPIEDCEIKTYLLFNSPFVHPSVMFRNVPILDKDSVYDNNYKYAEDYYLWVKLLTIGKGKNLDNKLLYYRDTPNSESDIGRSKIEDRRKTLTNIKRAVGDFFKIDLSKKDLDFLYELSLNSSIKSLDFKYFDISYIKLFFKILRKRKDIDKRVIGFFYFKIWFLNIKRLGVLDLIVLCGTRLSFYGFVYFIKNKISNY